jgi:hypothetical protein
VIGNPPYLSQLSTSTARGGRSNLGGGPYADAAAEFLALSVQLVRPVDGRVGLVLPMSILATRDVAPIRESVGRAASIELCWWADESVFDASVRTCVLGLVTGRPAALVRRLYGADPRPIAPVATPTDGAAGSWSWLVADASGVPSLTIDTASGTLIDLATATADFRDQYYGLVGAVSDTASGPPLITSGLIDVGVCRWGERPTRFAKEPFDAPRVDLSALSPALQAWARTRLVPKVLVASQTKVIEAVADLRGEWLPSVPVISVIPHNAADVGRISALLTSPVASAWLVHQRLGTGLSAQSIRVTAADLARLPLPTDTEHWDLATASLAAGDVLACGRHMLAAYGLAESNDLSDWWAKRVSGSTGRRG